jgi:hypothetical protein
MRHVPATRGQGCQHQRRLPVTRATAMPRSYTIVSLRFQHSHAIIFRSFLRIFRLCTHCRQGANTGGWSCRCPTARASCYAGGRLRLPRAWPDPPFRCCAHCLPPGSANTPDCAARCAILTIIPRSTEPVFCRRNIRRKTGSASRDARRSFVCLRRNREKWGAAGGARSRATIDSAGFA